MADGGGRGLDGKDRKASGGKHPARLFGQRRAQTVRPAALKIKTPPRRAVPQGQIGPFAAVAGGIGHRHQTRDGRDQVRRTDGKARARDILHRHHGPAGAAAVQHLQRLAEGHRDTRARCDAAIVHHVQRAETGQGHLGLRGRGQEQTAEQGGKQLFHSIHPITPGRLQSLAMAAKAAENPLALKATPVGAPPVPLP